MYATSKRGLYLLFKTHISVPKFHYFLSACSAIRCYFKLGFHLYAQISFYYATQLLVLLGQYCTEL
jgi:hypothetical protein